MGGFAWLLLVCLAITAQASDLILPSSKTGEEVVALVMFPGAELEADQYADTAKAVQEASSEAVWVGIVDSASATQFSDSIPRVLSALSDKGMPAYSRLFYAIHSPAESSLLQDYLVTDGSSKPSGLILMGSFVLRKYRSQGSGFIVPTLTLGGDADGVCRITRIAEAYANNKAGSSVVAIPGASHMQFASGSPSSIIQQHDLQPQASEQFVHSQIGQHVAAFMRSKSQNLVSEFILESSSAVFDPIVEAMRQEGFQWLNDLCNSDFPTNPTCKYPKWPDASLDPLPVPKPDPMPSSDCICGSLWVQNNAQKLMARFDLSPEPSASFFSKDSFHDVSDTHPFHLPHIFNECTEPAGCLLNTTTVTMPIYEDGDPWHKDTYVDDGLTPISVREFRTKLKSRQAMWQAAGFPDNITSDKADLDGSLDICKSINQASYDWAMSEASATVRERFDKMGDPYVFVDDVVAKIGVTGPEWIKDAMVYTPKSDGVHVQSWTFKTANTNHGHVPYIVTAGYHYCKILSPFRAMEWITVDGLRKRGSLGKSITLGNVENNLPASSTRKILR